ncbi:MAG: hypothetical protein LBM77_02070 [Spirochaetaceae bacterium]|nr:hypothetical protein [Spirochaetaceae bacterium]
MPSKEKKILIFILILVILGYFAVIFFNREPIVLLNDPGFTALYGKQRLFLRNLKLGATKFRRIVQINAPEAGNDEQIALAAESAAKTPFMAVFPFRYENAALVYKKTKPNIDTVVSLGRKPLPQDENGLRYVQSNTEKYLQEAIKKAEILVENTENKTIVIYSDTNLPESNDLQVIRAKNVPLPADTGALICIGLIPDPFPSNIPIILFSWLDPKRVPKNVKYIFDDSLDFF